jgi:DNA polymerase-3 subunit gamma/tau
MMEVDAASRTRVEDTRELLDNVPYAPVRGRFKVYLIDEVHMLSSHSFNALLKTLEEPPEHVKFLLATTDPQKIPVTVLSRCLQFHLSRLSNGEISQHLTRLLDCEQQDYEPIVTDKLAAAADGSVRDALSLLDQASAYAGGKLTAELVDSMLGSVSGQTVVDLLSALAQQDASALMAVAEHIYQQGADFSKVLEEFLSLLHQLALSQVAALPDTGNAQIQALAQQISAENVQLYYQIALTGRRDLPLAPDPKIGFEMLLLRLLAFSPQQSAVQPVVTKAAAVTSKGSQAPLTSAPPPKKVLAPSPAVGAVPNNSNWSDIVAALPLKGLALQLAKQCVLTQQTAQLIDLMLDKSHAKLLSEQQQERLKSVLQAHFSPALQVNIRIGDCQADSPAARQQQQQAEKLADARQHLANDTVLQNLTQAVDGTIDQNSIQWTTEKTS